MIRKRKRRKRGWERGSTEVKQMDEDENKAKEDLKDNEGGKGEGAELERKGRKEGQGREGGL